MSGSDQDEVLARVDELVRDWLERAREWWPDGFTVDEIGIAWAVDLPNDQEIVSTSCTETRRWAKAGLFRAAMLVADEPNEPDTDEDA